jgi:hypothetical protein
MGQEKFLPPGTRWVHKSYRLSRPEWDHDHCAFCSAKFVDDSTPQGRELLEVDESVRSSGVTTLAEHEHGSDYHWVCDDCFEDFRAEFRWVIA